MAYSDLNQNQTISLNNLQSGVAQGVFTAKTTIPSGTKQVTKNEANTYINVNTSLPTFVAKSSNQLVTKQDLSGITSTYPYLMYGVASYKGYKSIDGGATWSELTGLTSYDLDWTGIAGDSTGTYIAAICKTQNNQIYISNDGGNTFTATTISTILIGFYPRGVAMSNNGQYISVAGVTIPNPTANSDINARIAVSDNYGVSFGAGSYTDGAGYDMYYHAGKVSVSGNGQYMTAIFSYSIDPGFPNTTRPWSFRVYSSNYGSTWTKSGGSEFTEFRDIALDDTGQNQIITADWERPGLLGTQGIKAFVTNNYGSTWTERYSNTTQWIRTGGRRHRNFHTASVSGNGQIMIGVNNNYYEAGIDPEALPPKVITNFNYGQSNFASTEGYYNNMGAPLGNITTTGVTNGYVGMMIKDLGQFNYSVNGGTSFTPKSSLAYSWVQIYRKAFLYTGGNGGGGNGGGGGQTYYTWYLSQPQNSGCLGYGYYPIVVYSNNPSFLSGATFYTDSSLTNEFDGFGYWYMDSTFENGCTIQIGPAGETFGQTCC